MRPIELTLLILTMTAAGLFLLPKITARLKFQVMPLVLVLAAAAQVRLEGFRWQLWPLMIAVLLLLVAAGLQLSRGQKAQKPLSWAIVSLILAVISLAAGWLLPVPDPFPITGPYQVGTTVLPLKDTSRKEIYSPDPNDPREIMVQVWYPASPTKADERALWMPDIDTAAPALAGWYDLPSFVLNHFEYFKGNAYLDAPLYPDGEEWPILIFSHGWSGFKEQNIYQVEELASQGYLVVGINHTYGAIQTSFPDGRQMLRNDAALPEGVSQEEYDLASNRLVRQWAEDIAFVLDEFAQRDQAVGEWPFSGRVDFSKVGVFGHSTGGGATAEFCGTDARCKAALVMDLWVEPVSSSVVAAGLSQPFLLMHSADWVDLEEPSPNFLRIGQLLSASSGETVEFRVEGTMHRDFSVLPMLTPLSRLLGLQGSIDGDRCLSLINYYTVAFFDQYLRELDRGLLLPENAPYPEAQFALRP